MRKWYCDNLANIYIYIYIYISLLWPFLHSNEVSTRIHRQNTEMNYINPINVIHVCWRFLAMYGMCVLFPIDLKYSEINCDNTKYMYRMCDKMSILINCWSLTASSVTSWRPNGPIQGTKSQIWSFGAFSLAWMRSNSHTKFAVLRMFFKFWYHFCNWKYLSNFDSWYDTYNKYIHISEKPLQHKKIKCDLSQTIPKIIICTFVITLILAEAIFFNDISWFKQLQLMYSSVDELDHNNFSKRHIFCLLWSHYLTQ